MNGELEQLGERIAEQAAHLDAATHRLLADLREFDERGGWRVQGTASCAHWLAWRVGWDLVTARDHVRVAHKLAEFSLIDDALRRGEVSYSKVRALVRVATPANESLLLDHARLMTASQLEKLCRKYALVQRHGQDPHPAGDEQRRYVRRRDTEDGMVKIEAVLHPEEAEMVWAMLDHAAKQLAREPASGIEIAPSASYQAMSRVPDRAITCEVPDSAESSTQSSASQEPPRPPVVETQVDAAPAAASGHVECGWVDDSAESSTQSSELQAAPCPRVAEAQADAAPVASVVHEERGPVGDSAESSPQSAGPRQAPRPPVAETQADAAPVASVVHEERGPVGDSAESSPQSAELQAAPCPRVTEAQADAAPVASIVHEERGPVGDSAESSPQSAGPRQAPRPPVAETQADAAPVASVVHEERGPVGDSAESSPQSAEIQEAPRPRVAEAQAGAAPAAASGHVEGCPVSDSAESSPQSSGLREPARARVAEAQTDAAPATSSGHVEGCPVSDSAESLAAFAGMGDSTGSDRPPARHVVARPPWFGRFRSHDCAEPQVRSERSPVRGAPAAAAVTADHASERSLLERLLDEADALRDAEAAARDVGDRSGEPATERRTAQSVHRQADSAVNPGQASVLRQRAGAARRAFHRADALVSVAQAYLRGDRPDRLPIELTLTIPLASLHGDAPDTVEVGEMNESFLSTETVRRLSCDAGVIELVEDGHGAPLSVGRKRRTISGALKRALCKRDRACTFPGCTNRLFLEGHHVKHWADGGDTSLMNSALLCSLHHRHVHEYGYTIELGPDQRPRFHDARGRVVEEVPERPATPGLGWPRIREMNEALGIDAATIAGPWDGTPIDYGTITRHLAAADGMS